MIRLRRELVSEAEAEAEAGTDGATPRSSRPWKPAHRWSTGYANALRGWKRASMQSLQRNTYKIRSFFQEDALEYAA